MRTFPEGLKPTVAEFLNMVEGRLQNNTCNDWIFNRKENKIAKQFMGKKYLKLMDKNNFNSDVDVVNIIRRALDI